MSDFAHSLVTICPVETRDALLALGDTYGVAGGMDVALSADGGATTTHVGSHAWATPEFVAAVTQVVEVVPPGYTAPDVKAILDACTFSIDRDGLRNAAHFEAVCAALGLVPVAPIAVV